eukprot:TRINITY_DN8215_c0_g1_i3.p1 TRINITY_DN8215_c0_g1~~TRINITY_DN8215_c0_g1_i3.p1  ORF type:complete len:271 (-),score=48.21 TRINITY_DN8215_c0_g1_i3:58-870(-)
MAAAAAKSAKWIEKVNRRLFIGGNWKCNGTMAANEKLIQNVINKISFNPKKIEVLVSPVFVHLLPVKKVLQKKVILSAQNIGPYSNGPFTGEITAEQLKDFGIDWTLLGHSERRTYFKESDNIIGIKTRLALDYGLNVVLCIGEKLEERESGKTLDVCLRQIAAVNKKIHEKGWDRIVIAYEPVWAIGTGKIATPAQAQEVHEAIREWLEKNVSPKVALKTRIIYGGSVSEKNASTLIEENDIDGFLIGGAALKPAFKTVVDICSAKIQQ